MPELPEVENSRRRVDACALRRKIVEVTVGDAKLLRGGSPAVVAAALEGRRFDQTFRHGKWLFLRAGKDNWLAVHFGMTGDVWCEAKDEAPRKYVRLAARFADGGRFVFDDPRKFGECALTPNPEAFLEARGWGPDPYADDFSFEVFRDRITAKRGNLKGVLLDQGVVAGIGNLWSDEMLYQCGLHPQTRVEDLKPATVKKLYDAMMDAFAAALQVEVNYENLPKRYFTHHRESDLRCPKCGEPLEHLKAGGRTSYFCPAHQSARA